MKLYSPPCISKNSNSTKWENWIQPTSQMWTTEISSWWCCYIQNFTHAALKSNVCAGACMKRTWTIQDSNCYDQNTTRTPNPILRSPLQASNPLISNDSTRTRVFAPEVFRQSSPTCYVSIPVVCRIQQELYTFNFIRNYNHDRNRNFIKLQISHWISIINISILLCGLKESSTMDISIPMDKWMNID